MSFDVTVQFGKGANSYLTSEILGLRDTIVIDNIAELHEVTYKDGQGNDTVLSEEFPGNPMVAEMSVFVFDAYLAGEEPNVLTREFSAGALTDLGVYPLYAAIALFGMPKESHYFATPLRNGADGRGIAILRYAAIVEKSAFSNTKEYEAVYSLLREHPNVRLFEATRHIHQPNFKAIAKKIGEMDHISGATLVYEKYSSHNDYELAAVYSRRAETGAAFAADFGDVPVFTDLADFYNSGIEVVYIASPNSLHYDQVVQAIEHELHG
ncbi:Gfo/Idh/MocA family oxidoreductase [Weissella confusa]|uniref:Gfo/Idh/MocA family oxidoreductase n=1 Tax=Weissella confusa TaxID=1583 RepID=A0A923NDI6_WEICO|nr:Gfo/Idh/MocA family oxidoreductase [Weissella confusa]